MHEVFRYLMHEGMLSQKQPDSGVSFLSACFSSLRLSNGVHLVL